MIRVKNLNESLWTQMVGMSYVRLFYIYKIMENQFLTSRCVCGPLASFRKQLFIDCIPMIEAREFLGVKPIRAGEDTYITTCIALGIGLKKKWKIFLNFQALAWTENPARFTPFLYQQLRWWRGGILNGTQAISKLRHACFNAGVMPAVIATLTTVSVRISLCMFPLFWLAGNFLEILVAAILGSVVFGAGSCLAYNHYVGKHDNIAGRIKNPIATGVLYGAWTIASWLILTLFSIFTMDDGGWVTRQDGQTNK